MLALLSERSIGQAAAKAAINERTLRRWLSEDEAFQAEYAAARQATFQAGIGRVSSSSPKHSFVVPPQKLSGRLFRQRRWHRYDRAVERIVGTPVFVISAQAPAYFQMVIRGMSL